MSRPRTPLRLCQSTDTLGHFHQHQTGGGEKRRRRSLNQQLVRSSSDYLMLLLKQTAPVESSSTGTFTDCCHFDQQKKKKKKAASVLWCLVVFEVADVDDGDEICSCGSLNAPQPPTADLQQVDRRHSLWAAAVVPHICQVKAAFHRRKSDCQGKKRKKNRGAKSRNAPAFSHL